MTRKIVALLLIGVVLLSLPACKEEPKNTHSDWLYIPSSAATGALTEDGYYYARNSILNYADLATETSVVLCQKPGCKHELGLEGAAKCDAEVRIPWMVFGNDTLYYVDLGTLYSRNATGGDLKELGTLAKELVEDGISVDVSPKVVSNGYLYYGGTIKEIKQTASGGTSSTSAGSCFGRFNLALRKDELLVVLEPERYNEGIKVIAARENDILYLHHEGLDPEQDWEKVDAKKRLEAQKKMPVHINHLNTATGETTVLFTTTYAECKSVLDLENGKIIYNKPSNGIEHEISSYDLNTGKVETVYKGDFSSSYYGKGYWLRYKLLDAKTAEYHIYDNTGKTLPYELEGNFTVTNKSANGMVMMDFATGIYSFVSFDSLADGLQEEDLKFLYSNS
jgi:hypothetical protein